ncbi:MAG: Zn-dependent protease [Segetibacter sp.]|nr:Zn-dependent protease [Segetibacter sp.]
MKKIFLVVFLLKLITVEAQTVFKTKEPLVHTFSIVARDPETGEMAVGVQSHWFSVGTAVPWAEAGVGVVATQSFVDKSYGVKGLALLKQGLTAQQALDTLLKADEGREVRQVSIIDSKGNVATHTGKNCIKYADHIVRNNFSVQSNMMLGSKVCESMATAYELSKGKPLAERVLLALEAAQTAGGDIRGMQAAALVVVPGKSTGASWNDRTADLRVDDNPLPLKELRRLYNVHLAYLHMNNGDLAVEKNDMPLAMKEYNAAMKMFPGNLEMQYWTAITLANNKDVQKAMPILKQLFAKDKNWKELTRRLPPAGLLTVSEADLKKILAL